MQPSPEFPKDTPPEYPAQDSASHFAPRALKLAEAERLTKESDRTRRLALALRWSAISGGTRLIQPRDLVDLVMPAIRALVNPVMRDGYLGMLHRLTSIEQRDLLLSYWCAEPITDRHAGAILYLLGVAAEVRR